VAEVR